MSIRAGHGCRSVPRRAAVLAAAALLLAARNAAACAMCLSFQGAQRQAYYVTTLILLAVPLGIAGAFAFWLYRAARASRLAGSAGRGRAKTLPDAESGSAGVTLCERQELPCEECRNSELPRSPDGRLRIFPEEKR